MRRTGDIPPATEGTAPTAADIRDARIVAERDVPRAASLLDAVLMPEDERAGGPIPDEDAAPTG